ncbi:hypothetical protein [Paenibacillus donghaensis]|uniref:hypothetical protein n=1 Tax=Paenibacillus donghaensis TaxID=414771 RepID=UPI0012FE262B|nr:hypothetical protein [Paenibacillus donghaensis]
MLIELMRYDFYKVQLLADLCPNLEVKAIVSGNNPGAVYVDDAAEPMAALIWVTV